MITPINPLTTTKIGFKKNPIPNKSVSSDILKQEEQEIKKRSNGYILAGTALAIAGVTIGSILYIKKPNKISGIKLLKEEMSQFPKDVEYRKAMLKALSIPESEYYKIRSIIGVEEFEKAINTLSRDKENFLPGKISYRKDLEAIFPNRENVYSGKYSANLHLHTKYSDGKFSISELLDQASRYADERVVKLGKEDPFYLAITDHDTVQGCKEAVKIIMENPEKYKNLRLLLGVEHTTTADYYHVLRGPVQVHLLSYGINPYSAEVDGFLSKYASENKKNIENVINHTNTSFKKVIEPLNFRYSYEELLKLAPSLESSSCPANYYTKDYLQFRLIYASVVENNKNLMKLIKSKNIDIDFVKPISKIPSNPDYSMGQKYYEYYFQGIRNYIKSQINPNEHHIVDTELRDFPSHLYDVLNKVEYSIHNRDSGFFIPQIKHSSFEEVVRLMEKQEFGVMSIAHPGVVFPAKNLKSEADTLKLYDLLYRDFKNFGKEKAKYAEDHYGAYFESNLNLTAKLSEISTKHGLEKTGGLDTHISDIFCSK